MKTKATNNNANKNINKTTQNKQNKTTKQQHK